MAEVSVDLAAVDATADLDPAFEATVEDSEAEPAASAEASPEPNPEEHSATEETPGKTSGDGKRWPGWPGENVFRLIVPVSKVGGIIGHKGELIKKLCEETRARVRILDGPTNNPDRVVLVTGREEPEAEVSPAMDAVVRVCKRVYGIPETGDDATTASSTKVCSVRLLVPASQSISLIGKQGNVIKSIQESSEASVRVLPGEEVSMYATADERIIDIQGESLKVLKAVEAIVGHLRKFLVDHGVLPLFEKSLKMLSTHDQTIDAWGDSLHSSVHNAQQTVIGSGYPLPGRQDPSFLERDAHISLHAGGSLYGPDSGISGLRSPAFGRVPGGSLFSQITQTMEIPLMYAEDIIGVRGSKISYIRNASGALLTIKESPGYPDQITVEIKGTSQEVLTAQQLIQDFIAGRRESDAYGSLDSGTRSSSYSHISSSPYTAHSYGGSYGSSEPRGYGSYRF